jgi:hypothetical protein
LPRPGAGGDDGPLKAPPITLQCDCGVKGDVAYGERWTCPSCGRQYDTGRIPREDYEAILAVRRRYRRIGWALSAAVALLVLVLALAGEPVQILAGLPLILLIWFVYVRPLMRRRFQRAIADRPRWQLTAERTPKQPRP